MKTFIKRKTALLTALLVAVTGMFTACGKSIAVIGGADGPTKVFVADKKTEAFDIEKTVSEAILAENKSDYKSGECAAEGHIILGTESGTKAGKSEDTIVYALTTYGEYGFENAYFIKVSGSGAIPTRITFDKNGKVTEYLTAKDGSEYEPSIKEMFPKSLWSRAISGNDADYKTCAKQEKVYAEKYLKSIGRTAQIGEYADFEHILPDMDTEASNTLLDLYGDYPYWIGTIEQIENNVRYVYETKWNSENRIVTYIKYEYISKKVIEETSIDTTNGKLKYLRGTPRSSKK